MWSLRSQVKPSVSCHPNFHNLSRFFPFDRPYLVLSIVAFMNRSLFVFCIIVASAIGQIPSALPPVSMTFNSPTFGAISQYLGSVSISLNVSAAALPADARVIFDLTSIAGRPFGIFSLAVLFFSSSSDNIVSAQLAFQTRPLFRIRGLTTFH